ncbi:unnamed protein product [Sphagnum troendelagicum]|uniref:Major facilitator superfamily (MFS) profile domain-containing protein n=1 Tax=Sphagnum troendelagicum TaxID=128251 RepID=A0ABP0U6N0_9BRYO
MERRDDCLSLEEGLIVNSSASADAVIMDIEAAVAAAAACSNMENHNNMLQEEEEEEHNIDLLHDDSDAARRLRLVPNIEKLSVDDLLQKWVGECGRAQLWHFVLVSLAWTIHGLQTFAMVFADRQPSWQCRSSPSQSLTSASTSFSNAALNITATATDMCTMDSSLWEWVGGKGVSTVSEWNLVCGDEYKRGLAQSVFFIGGLFGAGVFGNLSDSVLGRKGALVLACAATAISGLITAAAPNYWAYVIMRGVTGLSTGGVGLSSFVLATEPVGPSRRGQMGMSAFYFFSLGVMALPVFAFYTGSWRLLYVVTSIPAVIYCAIVLPFVCESPRWYLIQGRLEEAMAVMRNFATLNGKSLPTTTALMSTAANLHQAPGAAAAASATRFSGTLLDVMKCSGTRNRMLIMVVIWFNCAIVYYGINLNVVNIGFDLYLSVFTNGLVEIPAYAITALLLQRLGRRKLLVASMLLPGVCCIMGSLLSSSNTLFSSSSSWTLNWVGFARLLCGVIGIFGIAGAYNLVYIYTLELFPTVVRNAALGLATQAAGIGAVIAPTIVALDHYNSAIPFGLFAAAGLVGALLALWLPETLNQPLWETLQGMENASTL